MSTRIGPLQRPAPDESRPMRSAVFGTALGVGLVVLGVAAVVAAVSYLLIFLGQLSSMSSPSPPEDALLAALGGVFTVILVAIALRYVYYYWCWATTRRDFGAPPAIDENALRRRGVPTMKFAITTRGGALPVVERSIALLLDTCSRHPWLAERVLIEVITEQQAEADHLNAAYAGRSAPVAAVCLPPSYATDNGTGLKARALQYMVELRRAGFNRREGRSFIVHFDEETVMTEQQVLRLADYLSKDPAPVSQGPILYPLEWEHTPWLCRAIESTRPFGCSECARVMQNPPPPHLHGSNLVISEDVEDRVGWDFGSLDGQAFIAEDLLFGLRAYALLGRDAFGWHGATALEQPPLSLYWAVQQRVRWVTGALQGLRAVAVKTDYHRLSRLRRVKLRVSVYSRIATYALGFPVGLVGLVFLFHPAALATDSAPLLGLRSFLVLSALAWVLSYQIGMHRNIRSMRLPWYRRLEHHAGMLILTPIVGICETTGPFVSLVRWLVGRRDVAWTPTPKLAERPSAHPASSAVPVTMPAWLVQEEPPAAPARRRTPRSRLRTASWSLTAAGLAVVLFLGFEFGGSALLHDRAQQDLLTDFKSHVAIPATTHADGSPLALLDIPAVSVHDEVVVQGTTVSDLETGPGHVVDSPMPGEFGNTLIMGRRTTYGSPFRDINRLVPGDMLTVTTSSGSFQYRVTSVEHPGRNQASVLNGTLDSRLTLLTSDPEFSPTGRLAVVATLVGTPLDLPHLTAATPAPSSLGLAGDWGGFAAGLGWLAAFVAACLLTVRFRRAWPARVVSLVATPVLLTLFLLACTGLDHVLPGTL